MTSNSIIAAFIQRDRLFILLIVVLLLFIPTTPVINALSLQFNGSDFWQQPWRLLTAHLVHASWQHLLLNIVNLVLLRMVFREWLPDATLLKFFIYCSLVISIGLWLVGGHASYVGFSGVFHGLLLYLLLHHWQQSRWLFSLALLLVLAKIGYEQRYGASTALIDFIGVSVAIHAHALGAFAGVSFWLLEKALTRITLEN